MTRDSGTLKVWWSEQRLFRTKDSGFQSYSVINSTTTCIVFVINKTTFPEMLHSSSWNVASHFAQCTIILSLYFGNTVTRPRSFDDLITCSGTKDSCFPIRSLRVQITSWMAWQEAYRLRRQHALWLPQDAATVPFFVKGVHLSSVLSGVIYQYC